MNVIMNASIIDASFMYIPRNILCFNKNDSDSVRFSEWHLYYRQNIGLFYG